MFLNWDLVKKPGKLKLLLLSSDFVVERAGLFDTEMSLQRMCLTYRKIIKWCWGACTKNMEFKNGDQTSR